MVQILIIYTIVATGAMCKGAIGMGFALVAAPLLRLIDPAYVPVPMILSGFFLSILVIMRDRTALDLSGLRFAITGRLVGSMIAAPIAGWLSADLFGIIFAGIIFLAILGSLVRVSWEPTPSASFGAGLASGMMGTLSSIGGPPMALLYQHQQGATVRGTLAGFSLIGTLISLTALFLVGKCTLYEVSLFIKMIPALLLGFLLSRWSIRFLDTGYTQKAILSLSALSALTVIIKICMRWL